MSLHPATAEALASALCTAHQASSPVGRVDLSALTRVLEHSPGDMTVTAEAGCALAALQRALAAHGQWLPIDPPNPDTLNLTGLLDHNLSGPRRCGFGTIRDYVIGLRVALADGRLIRNGGKVVKNVAGYDLMKLFIGARGTLGVIIEVTFKLLPLPEIEAFVQARCESLDAAEKLITIVLDSELTPTVFDLHSTNLQSLVLGFSGSRAAVDWQLALARALGFTEPATLDYDAAFHAPGLPAPQRLSVLPSRLVATLQSLNPSSYVARVANGVIHHRADLMPPQTETPLKLSRRVKDTFDPNRIFPDLPL